MHKQAALPPKGWIREAQLLGLNVLPFGRTKLRQEVAAGRFPAPHQFSRKVVAYDCSAVHTWIDEQASIHPPVTSIAPRPVASREAVAA